MKIAVCGAGNAAHVLIPLLGSRGEHTVTVFAPLADEADRLRKALGVDGVIEAQVAGGAHWKARPALITADPAAAATGVDLLLLALPAFAHEPVLRALAPHLPRSAWIVALPARGGFDWLVRQVLPGHDGVIVGLQTLPWACRIREWGRRVDVLGSKAVVDLAAAPASAGREAAEKLSRLLAVPFQAVPNFLALTLANTGQLIHPGIMYGLFHDWDGQPFGEDQVPLFYGGVDDETAAALQAMSDEVQTVCRALERLAPWLDLSSVASLRDWLLRAYPGQIADDSSLRAAFNTNRAYAGLRASVKLLEKNIAKEPGRNQYVPWFTSRYLAEDVPYSLLVTRGIAELAGVPTPTIDRVITWAQERLGREYLVDGRVAGQDVARSRAPQRFDMSCTADLVTTQPDSENDPVVSEKPP